MASDTLADALSSLSPAERARLLSEADRITGLTARRELAERRRERQRRLFNRSLPRMAVPAGEGLRDMSLAELLERRPAAEVIRYSRKVLEVVDGYRQDRLLTATAFALAEDLPGKYRAVIEMKAAAETVRAGVEQFEQTLGTRDRDWLTRLEQTEPERAAQYRKAKSALRSAETRIRNCAAEIAALQEKLERGVEAILGDENRLRQRLTEVLGPMKYDQRQAVEAQIEAKIACTPPEKRLRLLSQLIDQLACKTRKPR